MNVSEYQTSIIRQVLLISEKNKLDEISSFVKKFKVSVLSNKDKSEEEKDLMQFETFEDWDAYLQSKEYKDPDEFLHEWNMTSYELRKFIWDSEHSGDYIPVEQFYEKLSNL